MKSKTPPTTSPSSDQLSTTHLVDYLVARAKGSAGLPKEDLHQQLVRYAEDLQNSVGREHDAQRQLAMIVDQLKEYTIDLRKAVLAEHTRARQLEESYLDTILRLGRASSYRDDETQAHAGRLGLYSRVVAEALELSPRECAVLATVAPMHDIGKIGIPDEILLKQGPLTPKERKIMCTHPAIGANMLDGSPSDVIDTARLVALTHHESWDGSGYPQGLAGVDIPIVGRIVKFVDVYDALRSVRPYKKMISHEDTCRILTEGDGRTIPTHFDPQILEILGEVHEQLGEIYEQNEDE